MSVFLLPCTAIGMIIGALIHYRFVIGIGLLAFAILVGISAAFRTGNRRAPFGMLIVFISVMSAWQYARFRDMPPDSHEMPEIVRIDTVPILKNEKWRALGTDPQSHRQWLIFFGESVPSYGDLIRVQGRILPVSPPTNPGQFDYPAYLKRHSIAGTIRVSGWAAAGKTVRNPFKVSAAILRHRVVTGITDRLPHPDSDLLIGLTFGEDGTDLPDDWVHAFRRAGLMHLLVVSGSQVALIVGLVTAILSASRLTLGYQIWILSVSNTVFYFLCGGGASILRAILMSQIALIAKWGARAPTPLYGISATCVACLLVDPATIIDCGALLSFAATGALIWAVPSIRNRLTAIHPFISAPLAMSLAPFLFTLPILWFQFGTLSVISLVANLLVAPLIELTVMIGVPSGFLGMVPNPISELLNYSCFGLMRIVLWITQTASQIPFAAVNLPHPPIWMALGIGIAIWSLVLPEMAFFRLERRVAILILAGLSFGYIITTWLTPAPLVITMLDVGQGDSTVIHTPSGYTFLIDAGNRVMSPDRTRIISDYGRDVVVPALRSFGINTIDGVIITHYDQDHVGGIPSVLREFKASQVYDNGGAEYHGDWATEIRRYVPRIIPAPVGTEIRLRDGVKLRFLHGRTQDCFACKENDRSVVVQIRYGTFSALITGDCETGCEDELIQNFGKELKSDVLKLGHHGSHTSSSETFLAAVRPSAALISAGRRNRYHHPHVDVINRLRDQRIRIYRTDRQGAVMLTTDGVSRAKITDYSTSPELFIF